MAKVFISFLGTTTYAEVTYVNQANGIKTTTPFVQCALVNSLCRNWTAEDRILIFRTQKSNTINWLDTPSKARKGLKTCLNELIKEIQIPSAVNPGEAEDPDKYIVPSGFTESELWEIFGKVTDNINEGDHIFFDVTHAFRTIPLFASILFDFTRSFKNTMVQSIHYGAWESVKDTPGEDVPLIDLTNFIRLQLVNEAVSNFKQFGEMGSIIKILKTDRRNLASIEQVEVEKAVANIQEALRQMKFYTQTCNLEALFEGSYYKTIKAAIDPIVNSLDIPEPQRVLLDEITYEMETLNFSENPSFRNIEAAVNWTLRKNLIQQSITMASEYLKESYYRLYLHEGYKVGPKDHDNRSGISAILMSPKEYNFHTDSYEFKYHKACSNLTGFQRREIDKFINIDGVSSIEENFTKLNRLRNGLNHGDELPMNSFAELKNNFKNIWNNCLNSLHKLPLKEIWEKN